MPQVKIAGMQQVSHNAGNRCPTASVRGKKWLCRAKQWSALCFVLVLLHALPIVGGLGAVEAAGKANFDTSYKNSDGWAISWDRAIWQAVDSDYAKTSRFDLDLTGAASIVSIGSQPNTGPNAKACAWKELSAMQKQTSTQDFSAPLQLQGGSNAEYHADFSYTFGFPTASTIAVTGWVQCKRNWPKNGIEFIVRHIAPNAAFPDANIAFTKLLTALTGPGQAPVIVASGTPQVITTDEATGLATIVPPALVVWWTSVFFAHGRAYPAPGYDIVTGNSIETGCEKDFSPNDKSEYCPIDGIVYLTPGPMANRSEVGGGTGTVAYTAAHEWAHHVEQQYGWINPNPDLNWPKPITELTADCLAGAFLRWEVDVHALTENQVFNVLNLAFDTGGNPGTDHGTREQRFFITYLGFSEGADSCSIF
ncbi:putative metalloprotease [Mycolicibacterium sp. BK634]|uniref:neutral zinc metallopeptidase n=1 Tax=Mycolicibacterium sp. BK634 TaxID=2587099 RepID=UPI00161ADEF9|nr:neutral zinc metallopeptidase [Mycolicibacterium sp. BK634]MBB3753775.1 putative metalloprotease [Mycolicibacterium sp. BK634]